MIPHIPPYNLINQRLQAGQSLPDIGCFLGQDLRRLVADGAPADRPLLGQVVAEQSSDRLTLFAARLVSGRGATWVLLAKAQQGKSRAISYNYRETFLPADLRAYDHELSGRQE